MLIHVHGSICLLLLECQTTGRTSAGSIRLHTAADIALHIAHCSSSCTIVYKEMQTRPDFTLNLITINHISISPLPEIVDTCIMFFLFCCIDQNTPAEHGKRHTDQMSLAFIKVERVQNALLALGGMTVSLENRRCIVL